MTFVSTSFLLHVSQLPQQEDDFICLVIMTQNHQAYTFGNFHFDIGTLQHPSAENVPQSQTKSLTRYMVDHNFPVIQYSFLMFVMEIPLRTLAVSGRSRDDILYV